MCPLKHKVSLINISLMKSHNTSSYEIIKYNDNRIRIWQLYPMACRWTFSLPNTPFLFCPLGNPPVFAHQAPVGPSLTLPLGALTPGTSGTVLFCPLPWPPMLFRVATLATEFFY